MYPMIKTFTGYSADGLDLAVKDAYKDYEKWLDGGRKYTTVLEYPPATTANVTLLGEAMSYWFTLTITYREAWGKK